MTGSTLYHVVRIASGTESPIGRASTDVLALYAKRDALNCPKRGEWPLVRYGVRVTGEVGRRMMEKAA